MALFQNGIDVSRYQGSINWPQVAAGGQEAPAPVAAPVETTAAVEDTEGAPQANPEPEKAE